VFTKQDIQALAQALWQLYQEAKCTPKEDREVRVKYSISFEDDSTSSSSGGYRDVFADGEWIDLKRANEIRMYFEDRTSNREVDLVIVAGNERRGSLTVEGPDQDWVGGIFKRFQTIIESAKPQPVWILRYVAPNIPFVFGIASWWVGKLVVLLLIMLTGRTGWCEAKHRVQELAKENNAVIWIGGLVPATPALFYVQNLLYKLWPRVEFDFGPEHLRLEKQRRRKITWLIGTILMPKVIDVVMDRIAR